MRLIQIATLVVFAFGFSAQQVGFAQSQLTGKIVRFCGDGSGWPPYTYLNPENGEEVIGYDVDVVREVLDKHGIKAEFFMPSWKQCQEHSAEGVVFHVALSASYNEERAKTYLMSAPYYAMQMHYFYSKTHFADKPDITSAQDLFKFGRVCGRYSYNYEGTGVLKNEQIARIGKTFPALISRTLSGDCTFFLARPMAIFGFGLIGKDLIINEEIGHAPVPQAHQDLFYMLISRKAPFAEELKEILDNGIRDMERSGRLKEIMTGYYNRMGIEVKNLQ